MEQAVRGRSDPSALRLWGKTQLLLAEYDGAITTLTAADQETQAGYLSDLAAAYIARGSERDNNQDIRHGLELADRALASGARDGAVLFNRALALERLGRRSEAVRAWRDYIAAEKDPDWRREGEDHLSRLNSTSIGDRVAPSGRFAGHAT